MSKLLFLAKRYDLAVGDRFELFYRGVIRSMSPYKYYIHTECKKGRSYPRYYTFTPNENETGDHELKITLYDDDRNVIDSAVTTLHVVKPAAPKKKINVLCFGDSLTFNGVWPYEGWRRFTCTGGTPEGMGFEGSVEFFGESRKENVGYEGYGGWKWKEFCVNDSTGLRSSVWVKSNHHLDEHDQESVWETNGKEWILESIEEGRLKFKRGRNNLGIVHDLGDAFRNVSGGVHKEDIAVESFEYEEHNPFYDESVKGPCFRTYCERNGFPDIDYFYILLTWNGQYIPYNDDFSMHDPYIRMILDAILRDFPKAKIRLIGIMSPSVNGGITANYGCSGPYSDVFGDLWTVFNYDKYLEDLVSEEKYRNNCRYIDMKAQFDVENNMPAAEEKVNARCEKTELLGTNGVHPNMDGYLQIGDVFYRALVSDMDEEK
ncbi:MAG: SGNH/GDSL hydrolase family protein [Clostridia bacterium]|nr:SGNH/GDSL hydrolase family protein [Clostridia bacterium]